MEKKGILITNGFLRTGKFVEHYRWLKQAAGNRGIELLLRENSDFLLEFAGDGQQWKRQLDNCDFVIFWDKDIRMGRRLTSLCQKWDIPVFNPVRSVAWCDDKSETYRILTEWNETHGTAEQIALLPTVVAPMTYSGVGYTGLDFVDQVIQRLALPLVVKECFGSFGKQVYLAETREDVLRLTRQLEGKPFLYQKYLRESHGKDVRLQVVGDEVVAAMYRYSVTEDFRANITNGGHMKPYEPSEREKQLAVRVAKALQLDFAGVDLLFSKGTAEDADIVCEVNSNAHFHNMEQCTGVNVAECIMNDITEKMGWKH